MKIANIALATKPAEVDEITLEGRRVRVWNVDLPLDQVTLDPANPRIANSVALTPTQNVAQLQTDLENVLWEDPDVRDLYRQVLINGGLIERVIVRQDGRVVEGNCRTVVYRKLRNNQPTEALWTTIPSRVLPDDIAERDVAILLGEMHVAGKNTWSPFEKAGHIYRMHRDFALTQDEIAHRLRMSKSKINYLIRSFETMKLRYLRQFPAPGNIRKFSYFEELYKSPELRKWIDLDSNAEDNFVEWVGTGKLNQGAHVRELVSIVRNPDALQAMNEHGFVEAKRVLEEDDPAVSSKLFRHMREMTEELEQARIDDIGRVRKGQNVAAKRIVLDMHRALTHFIELCGIDRKSNDG
ncbi:MAG TPA: hypothetical protein VK629_02325 [Steroidobacteraceae bacterium]|nr:hypothetical protein [Steroidobacteraceae bacterium]